MDSLPKDRIILITSPAMISAEWLTERLRDGGYLPHFRVRDCRVIGTRESETATLHTLRIRYGDISVARKLPDDMVLKVYHAGQAQADKEVTFYRRILPSLRQVYGGDVDLSLTDVYDAHYDIEADQSHVLMAGIPSAFQHHHEPIPPTKRHFTQLADALARIHACLWEDERLGDTIGLAITEKRLDDKLGRQRKRYDQFLSDGMIVLDKRQRIAFDTVVGRMPAQVRERLLARRDITLIHNDLKPTNLLYSHNACRVIDWKNWRLGLAAEDLAYLIAFHWTPAKRKFEEPRFLKRHRGEMQRCGVRTYSSDDLMRDYRIAIGLRLGELIGAWQSKDWRQGKWPLWGTILTGLRAFDDLHVAELFGD